MASWRRGPTDASLDQSDLMAWTSTLVPSDLMGTESLRPTSARICSRPVLLVSWVLTGRTSASVFSTTVNNELEFQILEG
jgi:hypothetical protein